MSKLITMTIANLNKHAFSLNMNGLRKLLGSNRYTPETIKGLDIIPPKLLGKGMFWPLPNVWGLVKCLKNQIKLKQDILNHNSERKG